MMLLELSTKQYLILINASHLLACTLKIQPQCLCLSLGFLPTNSEGNGDEAV